MDNIVSGKNDGLTKASRARRTLRSAGQVISRREKGNIDEMGDIPSSKINGKSTSNTLQNYHTDEPLGTFLPRLAKRKTATAIEKGKDDCIPMDVTSSILMLEQSSDQVDFKAVRTTDVHTDENSAASQAFDALKNRRPSSSPISDIPKKVEGREIRQDHHLYGMTYAMMLGIRVLVMTPYFSSRA